MEITLETEDHPGKSSKKDGVFLTYKIIAITAVLVFVVVTSLVLLAAFFGPGRKNSTSEKFRDNNSGKSDDEISQLTCDVAIVGGGISGLYVAETLLRLHKETNVCLFERNNRFGGRIHDYTFQEIPGVPVSLGAWRVDETHLLVWELLKRFGIPVSYLAKNYHNRLEARGIFATDRLSLKEKAFPSLNHGRFQNATFDQMMRYLLSHQRDANKFASYYDFFSEYLTPEGFQLFRCLTGWFPDYRNQHNPRSLLELIIIFGNFKNNFTRPGSGLSAITRALQKSAAKLGAKIFTNEQIKVMEENREEQFKLITENYTVSAKKLVIAIPPQPMKQIKGSVAEKIQNDSIFQSVGISLSFKGFAVFEEAWWQYNSTGSRYLADEQEMLSSSDCLGYIFPYKRRGPKGEAVLQMTYSTSQCAVKWGELLKISKYTVEQQILRALKRLFPGVQIPKPLQSVFVYWDEGAVHVQRAGTQVSSSQVKEWAKRPLAEKDLFIVGEAYQPLRGWMEGALLSAQNALREGWGIKNESYLERRKESKQEQALGMKFDLILLP